MIVSCFWLFCMLDRFYMMFPMLQLQDMNIETKKVNSKVIFTSTRYISTNKDPHEKVTFHTSKGYSYDLPFGKLT